MNLKSSVSEKYDRHRNDLQAAGFCAAILASVYFLGKSRGKTNVFVCFDDQVVPVNQSKV
jgi:hypothetical protein